MGSVGDPALHTGSHLVVADLATRIIQAQTGKAPLKSHAIAPFETAVIGVHTPAQERGAGRNREDGCLVLVQPQTQTGQKTNNHLAPGVQRGFLCSEQQEIVHITQIGEALQLALDELVQRVEIYVGPELAGQVAYRQAARPQGCKQVVAREVNRIANRRVDSGAAVQDFAAQAQCLRIGNQAFELGVQQIMIQAWEKMLDIALEHVGVAPGKLGAAVQGGVGAFANPAGVRIVNEAPFPQRLDHLAQGMVDNPVAERRRRNQARLRIVDAEAEICARGM